MKTDDGCGMMPAIFVPTVLSLYSHPSKRAGISARPSVTCEKMLESPCIVVSSPCRLCHARPSEL